MYKKSKPTIFEKIFRQIEIAYDYSKGLDFLKVIPVEDLKLDSKTVSKGSPSGNKYLNELLKTIKINENDSILDIGSAKGSAIKTMSEFPFRRIDGLEISSKLVEISIKNFKKLKNNNIKIFHEDASNFKYYNNYKYFYLYNPFPEKIFEKVIVKMDEQIKKKKIFLIYNNPVCHELLINSDFFLIKQFPDAWGNGINLYTKSF